MTFVIVALSIYVNFYKIKINLLHGNRENVGKSECDSEVKTIERESENDPSN